MLRCWQSRCFVSDLLDPGESVYLASSSRLLPGLLCQSTSPSHSLADPSPSGRKAKNNPEDTMFRKRSSQLYLPLLALLVLSLIISIATLVCAAATLRLFDSQQGTNPWLLPIWRNHFDLRGLKLVAGTSAAIMLFDLVGVVVLVVLAGQVSFWLFKEATAPTYIPDRNTDEHFPHHSSSQYHPAPHCSYQP